MKKIIKDEIITLTIGVGLILLGMAMALLISLSPVFIDLLGKALGFKGDAYPDSLFTLKRSAKLISIMTAVIFIKTVVRLFIYKKTKNKE